LGIDDEGTDWYNHGVVVSCIEEEISLGLLDNSAINFVVINVEREASSEKWSDWVIILATRYCYLGVSDARVQHRFIGDYDAVTNELGCRDKHAVAGAFL
jgi:hypothetical protein